MTASELIKELQELISEYGDAEIQSCDDNMRTQDIDGMWFNAASKVYKISITDKE